MTDIVILHKAPDGSARIEQWLRNKDTVLNGTYYAPLPENTALGP